MQENILISICVPAFNEEKNIIQTVDDLFNVLSCQHKEFEIIIVNDGSSDQTPGLADSLSKKYSQIKVIHHAKNFGIGNCYRDALAVANGKYFTWFPSDGEDVAIEVSQCLKHAKDGVIVISYHAAYDRRLKLRRVLSRVYTLMLNIIFRQNLKYYNGISIISTQMARAMVLVSNGFFSNAEIVIRAVKLGCKVVEVSTPLGKRISGKSKALSLRSLWMAGRDIVHILHAKSS